jgi:hypothetical protein
VQNKQIVAAFIGRTFGGNRGNVHNGYRGIVYFSLARRGKQSGNNGKEQGYYGQRKTGFSKPNGFAKNKQHDHTQAENKQGYAAVSPRIGCSDVVTGFPPVYQEYSTNGVNFIYRHGLCKGQIVLGIGMRSV